MALALVASFACAGWRGCGRHHLLALLIFNEQHALCQVILCVTVIICPRFHTLVKAVKLLGGFFNGNPRIAVARLIERKAIADRQRKIRNVFQIVALKKQIDLADAAVVIVELHHSSSTSRSSGTLRSPV